jgi:pyruvate dehydrogenase (quinone)
MTQKTVAEIFVETLVAAGVTRIYGVVGDSLNGVRYGFPLYPVLS